MLKFLRNIIKNPAVWHYLLAFVALTLLYCYFGHEVGIGRYWRTAVMRGMGDAALFVAVFVLFGRRGPLLTTIFVWLAAAFLFANAVYFRFNNDIIPPSAFFTGASYNNYTFTAVPRLIKWSDVIFLLIPLALTDLYVFNRRRFEPLRWPGRLLMVGLAAFLYIFGAFYIAYKSYYGNKLSIGEADTSIGKEMLWKFEDMARRVSMVNLNGHVAYTTYLLRMMMADGNITLNDDERHRIDEFIARRSVQSAIADSVAPRRNLIFIVVESLNSRAVGRTFAGRSVTPVLDSLIASAGAVSCLNVKPQTSVGTSSDGHLIYNTGLLPVTGQVTAFQYAGDVFPSLVTALGYDETGEIIGSTRDVWNHSIIDRAYGLKGLYDLDDMDAAGYDSDSGADRAVFEYTLATLPKLQQPFYYFVTTITTHYPFTDPIDRPVNLALPDDMEPIERRYLERVNYFDICLGEFIDGLKAEGLYDNSLIVIASDHEMAVTADEQLNRAARQPITFVAVNTGLVENRRIATMNQIDVYPTILDLMGASRADGWRGVGHSVFTDIAPVDEAEAQEISDLIIRGDYFSK